MKILLIYLPSFLFIFGSFTSEGITVQYPENDEFEYKVVVNHEEQYSIWLDGEKAPAGWMDTKIRGSWEKCQAYIKEVWTDMRPFSIRKMDLPDNSGYRVVINHEEQYSIWPAELELAKGWKNAGMKGTLADCTDYIREVWTDMRPLSLRRRVERKKK